MRKRRSNSSSSSSSSGSSRRSPIALNRSKEKRRKAGAMKSMQNRTQ